MNKILLLTDIPPCKNYTAGLVLDQLCRFVSPGDICCYSVMDPGVDACISPDLSWIPIEYAVKPSERGFNFSPAILSQSATCFREFLFETVLLKRLVDNVVKFGLKNGCNKLWCVLQGQTMIRLSLPVAKGLNAPLYTQVWDPPSWWLRDRAISGVMFNRILNQYEKAISKSVCCAAASWEMAKEYCQRFNVRSLPVIASVDQSVIRAPKRDITPGKRFVIGIAGQLYASDEWNTLLNALDMTDWQIAGREVVVRIMGRYLSLNTDRGKRIEFLGWHTQNDMIEILSYSDLLYCPYWFAPSFKEEARLSFPSKVTMYLAAGIPILFHGPDYASPSRFLEDNDTGYFCRTLDPLDMLNCLNLIVNDNLRCNEVASNGSKALLNNLTISTMRNNFMNFLDIADEI